MNVGLWAEIRRLAEIEKLSGCAISRRLRCSRHTVAAALKQDRPPVRQAARRASILDPYKAKIDALLVRSPGLSAVRIREEIARGPEGYTGSAISVRRYVRTVRPARGRVYQEVHYDPGQAMQVDWGECGRVQIGATTRRVSVFVAVLCYSRRPLLLAADPLRTPRPGTEGNRRGRRAPHQAQCPGRTWRGTGPLRGLPG